MLPLNKQKQPLGESRNGERQPQDCCWPAACLYFSSTAAFLPTETLARLIAAGELFTSLGTICRFASRLSGSNKRAARLKQLGHLPRPVFDLLLRYAISEDGALHAEKFYRTASEEFASTRLAFRWRHLVALARVTASGYGHPAAGMAEAREFLGV